MNNRESLREPISHQARGRALKGGVLVLFAALAVLLALSSMLARRGEASPRALNTAFNILASSAPASATSALQSPAAGRFNHNSPKHSQIKCDNCHARKADALRPSLPGHRACISCHIKEFTATGFGICNNCHQGINAVRPDVLPFPERQSYGLQFSHVTHATLVGGERRADCSACHGVAGARATFPAHKECYVCHKAPEQVRAGERVVDGSCGVCHTATGKRGPFRAGGPAYRYRFSHDEHVRAVGNCTECHRVLGEGPAAVSQPRLSEHRSAGFAQSCGSCHNGRRAFGGEIEHNACARCHGRPMM